MGGITIQRFMITINDIRLFCRDTVEGQPTLLCLHGKWGRGETWTDLISRLGNRYRIIAPDQRGHGLSDAPVARYAPDDFAKDTHELIEQLT